MLLYFSGTGNSRWVADELGKLLNERVGALLDNPVGELKPDEALGFVFPVYAWGPPVRVTEALSRLQVTSVPAYIYFVCTCGDDTGKTADLFARAVERKGWHCDAGFSVFMPNTYVCLPGFDVDSCEVASRKLHEAPRRLEEIAARLQHREVGFDCYEGSFPWLKSYVIRPLFCRFLMSPAVFKSTAACISCGKCVAACPLHNIRLEKGRPVWGTDCAMCLSCYHHCPKHAIEYGSMTKRKGQYAPSRSCDKAG